MKFGLHNFLGFATKCRCTQNGEGGFARKIFGVDAAGKFIFSVKKTGCVKFSVQKWYSFSKKASLKCAWWTIIMWIKVQWFWNNCLYSVI